MTTLMESEANAAPEVIRQQLQHNRLIAKSLGERLRQSPPELVFIVGRGSSHHAGLYGKYLIEVETGIPCVIAAPSVMSIYKKNLYLKNALVLVISQSGHSPDILSQAEMARNAGAYCVALVNDESSPLAEMSDSVFPLCAGDENAVAATKSYLATLSAFLQLVSHWTSCEDLINSINSLPDFMLRAVNSTSQITHATLKNIAHCVVLGRGFGYAIANEVALKLKEVCAIHAEAFSSAEFLHGPVTLITKNLPVLNIAIEDESIFSHNKHIEEIKQHGARMIQMSQTVKNIHPRLAPLALMQRFYLDIAQAAVSMGIDPDAPPGLQKITRTL